MALKFEKQSYEGEYVIEANIYLNVDYHDTWVKDVISKSGKKPELYIGTVEEMRNYVNNAIVDSFQQHEKEYSFSYGKTTFAIPLLDNEATLGETLAVIVKAI